MTEHTVVSEAGCALRIAKIRRLLQQCRWRVLHKPKRSTAASPVHAASCCACVAAPATLHPGVRGAALSWPCLRCGWPALGTRLSANVSSASLVRSPMYACREPTTEQIISTTSVQRAQLDAKHTVNHERLRQPTSSRVDHQRHQEQSNAKHARGTTGTDRVQLDTSDQARTSESDEAVGAVYTRQLVWLRAIVSGSSCRIVPCLHVGSTVRTKPYLTQLL
jgi:hypothetical protein